MRCKLTDIEVARLILCELGMQDFLPETEMECASFEYYLEKNQINSPKEIEQMWKKLLERLEKQNH